MKRPRLNALRTFEAAGRHLSFSIAGEELGVSQAAVSQQIRQLEGYLDAKLFHRRNRGLSLTSVGEAYHLAAHEALDRLDTIRPAFSRRTGPCGDGAMHAQRGDAVADPPARAAALGASGDRPADRDAGGWAGCWRLW